MSKLANHTSIECDLGAISHTSKGGSIGSTPACSYRDLSSNTAGGNLYEQMFLRVT